MSMFQNEKIKEVANKVENLAIPLEAKIIKSPYTWAIILGIGAAIAVIF